MREWEKLGSLKGLPAPTLALVLEALIDALEMQAFVRDDDDRMDFKVEYKIMYPDG